MKYLFQILIILLLITGCTQSNQNKAEKVVDKFLYETMNDYKSLETISFSELDTLWYHHTSEISDLERNKANLRQEFSGLVETDHFSNPKARNEIIHLLNDPNSIINLSVKKTVDSLMTVFDAINGEIDSLELLEPTFAGFTIQHKFRANNRIGGTTIQEVEYLLDKEIQNVITYKEK